MPIGSHIAEIELFQNLTLISKVKIMGDIKGQGYTFGPASIPQFGQQFSRYDQSNI